MKSGYQERLDRAVKNLLAHLPKSATAGQKAFARQLFLSMPAADVEKIDPQQAIGLAISAFSFMQARKPGIPKIRIFTPCAAEHGYESRRLVVELINDDMPFLLDSLSAELSQSGLIVQETIHPIFRVTRSRKGDLETIAEPEKKNKETQPESFIHFEISALPAGLTAQALQARLERVLAFIRAAVADWQTMVQRLAETEADLRKQEKKPGPDTEEALAFLTWLRERNFVFLGYACGTERLGVCAVDASIGLSYEKAPLLSIAKSGHKSPVHRPVLIDVITVQNRQFVGLFTSTVYYQSLDAIPLLRQKLAHVMENAGLDPVSHDGKALKTILEFLPRDEIFQTSEQELLDVGMGLLALEAKPGVRLFARRDAFERFVSCMVFIPREYFSTQLRVTVLEMLAKAFHGNVESFYTQMTESPLARLHVILRATPGATPEVDVSQLEADISRFTHAWADELRAELAAQAEGPEAESLFATYNAAFPAAYVARYSVRATVFDIAKCAEALRNDTLTLDFYRAKGEGDLLHLKIYSPGEEMALSDILPILENMGLRAIDEHPFLITPALPQPREVWIRDFKLRLAQPQELVLDHVKPLFEEALLKAWRNETKNDRFNTLVLRASLSWRQVKLLRAYAKYLRQIGFAYAQSAVEQALCTYPAIAKNLVALFTARFDPAAKEREVRQSQIVQQIESQLAEVSSLVDDRCLRQLTQTVLATLRTNYYQGEKPVLSFKIRSAEVPAIPKPVPFAEIFVYGMRVQGIHLRGGKVARGGIRWSDRDEDFRTEVLGLMKAQMVKNAVIVPVGSKGGFVVKQPPANGSREALQAEGIECYRAYLRGLLDITDNIVGGAVVPPAKTVRHDDDDPYLVVAADKGTASFSDIANGISREYGFWLDDAFASGGSAGYDHKKMAITARGGWVSVTRHFHEMGVDIGQQEFSAAGIGDMSGDVFGNGMLLSDRIRLIAAFDHRHIFIDPAPNAKESFAERQRLFELPRSSWKDYDAKKISKGGGVFERTAKSVTLSREAQAVLGLESAQLTPDELVRAVLCAPVDLLWNGGIGTYVKAESETHDQVGDRANNNVRVNGKNLRCKVVGEGGNLGFTQQGRIEYARGGGRLNTDAIDNSGGVDCSDHEVNIKIAFNNAMKSGALTRDKRDRILEKMTDEVAQLVLKDNALQTQAISLNEQPALVASQSRLIRRLEKQGLLDRALEALPSNQQMDEWQTQGKSLTRPELAVLLAYSKIALYRELMASSLPDEPYFAVDLVRYFPKVMQQEYRAEIDAHPLRREIVATVMTNSLVNRTGITFFFDMQEEAALPAREVIAAYAFARDAFGLRALWREIEKNGSSLGALQAANQLIERATLWAMRHLPHPIEVEKAVAHFTPGIEELRRDAGKTLEGHIAHLPRLASACDIVQAAEAAKVRHQTAAEVYFALEEALGLNWLRSQAAAARAHSHWDRLALRNLTQDLYDEQYRLAAAALMQGKTAQPWLDGHDEAISRYRSFLEDLQSRGNAELAALLVALKHIKALG